MEVLDASEASTSLYSFSTYESTEDIYMDVEATEFDTSSDETLTEGCDDLPEDVMGSSVQILQVLPIEVINRILELCTVATLCNLGRCSTQTLVLSEQTWIWKERFMRHWGPDIALGLSIKKKREWEDKYEHLGNSNTPEHHNSFTYSSLRSSLKSNRLSLSDLSQCSNLSSSSSTTNSSSLIHYNRTSNADGEEYRDDGMEEWEDWKFWYKELHQAARLTKYDVKHGLRVLIEKHGLPNTTGAIARFLKLSMPRLATFALQNFINQAGNINIISYFLRLWQFRGLTVLQMLRLVLGFIRLPKSDSCISRIIEVLSLAWWEQNQEYSSLSTNSLIKKEASSSSLAELMVTDEALDENNAQMNNRRPNINNNNLMNNNANQPNNNMANPADATAVAGRRINSARLMQPLHLSPISILENSNPWEQSKVPVTLTVEDLRPRGGFRSPDAVSTMCFAILMLETDQRNSVVKCKMTENNFVSQSRGLNSGQNYPREMLRETYNSIKFHPLMLFTDKCASGRIQVQTQVTSFFWLSSNRTFDCRAEVSNGIFRVFDSDADASSDPIHTIPLSASSTIIKGDVTGPAWISTGMGTEKDPWAPFEIESLSVLGSTYFRFLVPAEYGHKWFSALHWNIHYEYLDHRAP